MKVREPVLPAGASWRDPAHVGTGRLPMRVPLVPATDEAALLDRDAPSPFVEPLDGTWAFALLDRPEAVTAEHVDPGTDDAQWGRVSVPGNWTMQGYDRPHYTNVRMPFPGPPPAVPDRNPTGVYRRWFRIPRAWRGRSVEVEVGGAESVLYVWCNGIFVGSGTDSRLSSSFDLTPHLRPGPNLVACVVVRWSAQSYVEDQDHWWMAGIHRRVQLIARAPVHVEDVRVTAELGADNRGSLRVDVEVAFGAIQPAAGWTVTARLAALDGRAVAHPALSAEVPHVVGPYTFSGHVVHLSATVPAVRPWSAEQPNCYRLLVSLRDVNGAAHDVVGQTIGFRTVTVSDGLLSVNGRPITVHGVNRHDHHPDRGKAVTLQDMRADLLEMKRNNIDAIRTSHYPNDPRLLDLCDELGLYVVDEANIEAHMYNEYLCNDPRFRPAWLERGARMVARDRNHPSVILWSLGNESGYGANHDALAGWIRRDDPSRPLHYEGAIESDWRAGVGWDGGAGATDIVCPMYASVEQITAWAEAGPHPRPLILCEYSHAMGNSNGGLADYWEAITAHPQLQGGFIWEWKDHGLRQRLDDGRERLAYGGQFGDEPNDANFVADGLCSADLVPHPAMTEVAWAYRPIAVRLVRGRLHVENRQVFLDTSWLRATWELLVDGHVRRRGTLAMQPVAPGQTARLALPMAAPPLARGQEAHLTVRFHRRRAAQWAPAGHLVSWDQVQLGGGARQASTAKAAPIPSGRPTVGDHGERITVGIGSLELTMDRVSGLVVGLLTDGRPLLAGPLQLELWRAPTDNDGLKVLPVPRNRPLARWRAAGLDSITRACTGVALAPFDGGVRITTNHTLTPGSAPPVRHHQILLITAGGVETTTTVDVPDELADLPRLGHSFTAPAGLDRVGWFGLGPGENYPDRCGSALVAWHESPVDELPYLMPQEFGLRCGVRRWQLTGADGRGLAIAARRPAALALSATHHTAEDLTAARDTVSLHRRDEVVVHVDVAHRGLGTMSCGPDTAPRHRLRAGRWRWSWWLGPTGDA